MQETTLRKIPSWSDMVSSDEWKSADAATRNEVRVKWLTDLARLRRYGFVSGSDDELASFARDNGFDAGQVMFAFNQANADMIDAGVNEGGGLGKALQGRAADDVPFYLPEPGGFAYDMSKAVESGANQSVGGVMGLADMATGGQVDGLHEASQRIFRANRDMMSKVNTSVTKGLQDGGVSGAARALALSLGEQVAQQGIQMAIGAATGGVGGLAAMGAIAAGNSWNESSEDDELSGWKVGAKVAVDTASEVLSEVFELPVLKRMSRTGLRTFVRELSSGKAKDAIVGAVKQTLSAGGLEGFGEVWGQMVQYLGEQYLKDRPIDGKELATQMVDAGITGFAMGAGLHAAGRASQNASELKGASRGSFERMLGTRELPEKYRTQRQRLQALDANVRMAEPITVGQPTDADRVIEKQRWLEWYDSLNEESRREFADTRKEIASQLKKLSATDVARTEAGERLWRLEQFLDDYETYSEGARDEYVTQAERAREQADALRLAFPGLEAIEPVEQKPKAEEAKAETPATEEKTSEPPKVEPPKADEPAKAEPKEEKPVEPPKLEPLPVKDDDVRHRNIETREYTPEEGDESLPANVLEAKRAGRVAKVVNPDGSDAGEMFVAVVDAAQDSGDIRVSGDKGYTNEELQNRTEAGARDIQVREIGEDIRPEKLMLYGETNSGTPIVGGEDMHVESGNGRVKALRYAYGHGKAQQYLDAIRKEAERLGIPFPEKARMPVLVRVTMGKRTQEQRMDMVNKANAQTGQLGMSDTEQAYSDAKSIARHPEGVWSLFSGSRTSSMFSGANREFLVKVHELIGKRPDDIDERMQWSESFEKRVTNAMLASLASNIEGFNAGLARQLIDEAPGTVNVKRGLAQTAPMVLRLSETMPEKNILPELGEALTHFVKYNAERNRNGIKVNEYLGQMTLGFDGEDRNDSPKMSRTAERIFRFMARAKSQRQVRDFIDAYVERAKRNSDSQSFLIEGMTSATKDEIVEDAIAVADRRDGDGGTNASMSDSSLASIEVPLVEGATMAKDVTGEKAVKGAEDTNHERVMSFARDAETRFPSVAFRAVHDLSELDDDVRSRVEDDAMRQGIDVSRADAMMTHDSSGRPLCVLVSGNLKGELSRQKIEHEVIGHYGLRMAFGRKFDGLLDAIHRDLGERIERELGESGYAGVYDMASDQSRRDATEEWLCQQAERGTTLWSRLAGRIRRWLRNLGLELRMTDADIADALSRGREAASAPDLQESFGARFSLIKDKDLLRRLNSEETVKVYRAMQVIGDKLYSPMSVNLVNESSKLKVQAKPIELGEWEQADEHPEIIKDYVHDKKRNVTYGRTHIDKGPQDGGGLTAVAYNPYIHASYSPLNDQFKGAWNRPNLVTVEVEVPKSELTSGYWAKGAKNHVGETKWLDGVVSRQLPAGRERIVVLSRYDRPLRIVPDSEVAMKIRDFLDGVDVVIPENTVTPSLRDELEKVGVRIGAAEKGNSRKKSQEELDRLRRNGDRWAERNSTKFSLFPHEPDTPETTAAKGQAMARRILAPDAVTSIKDERILNLPALTELAVALTNGNLTAVERIRMRGGFAEGVTRTNGQMASIQVLRELARYPQLGGVITVPEGLVSRQARLAMESFVEHGIPREQIRMTSTPAGEGNVTLMFTWEDKDMLRLRKVLAHEIGHVVDWTAGHTMRHNNILARVAGLVKKYLKHEIGETERTMDDLTTRKDVLRLAREARKNILPVRQAQGIKAKSAEGRKLFKDELARLIENESVKSGRFRRDVILDELRSLSKWWRGDFEEGDRYREKPAELYADFVSVLLTMPESVISERAPEVWRMVQNWQSNRKEFTVEWERLQKEMDGDYAGQNERLLRQLVEAFDQADEMLAQHNALPKPKETARELARKASDYVASLVQDRWHTLYRLSKEDMVRSGKEYRQTLASTIDSYLHSSSAEAYARDFIALWNRTQASHGLTQDEIGTFLLLRRIENDKTLAQRINTYGITPADATRLLGELRKRVGDEKWGDMERFHAEYWSMRQRALAKLTGSGAYSEELNDKMLDNEWYATRKTLSHVLPKEAMVGIGNGPSARIHAVRGSFEGTSNPMSETVLNDIRLMEGATLNRIQMQTVDILRQNVPDAAVMVDDLKKDTPNGFTRIRLWRKGKFESWDIDDVYAGGLRNILDGKMTSAAVKWLSAVNNVWRRGLTNYSPSFMLKNPLRDFDETFKNLPKSRGNVVEDLLSWLDAWAKGMKESFRYEFRGRSRSGIVERMMWDDYFIPGDRVFYDSVEVRTQMDKLAKMAGEPTANTTTPEGVRGAIMKAMEVIGKLSSALERGTKVGGEIWLQENTSLPMEERRSIVQRRVGSPDFARGGQLTPITNNLLIFSNAIIQGYAASYDAIRGDWRTFVKRWMLTDGSMTILSSLAASGLLLRAWKAASGDDREETAMSRMLAWLKWAYGNVSLYNLYNYIILPLWETERGETVFLRFPMGDQSKTMSKMLRSTLDAAMTDRVMSQSLTDQLSKVFKDDFLFSPQPAVAGIADILTMMGGNNPRDEYHDRPAVNSTQWNAGGWEKAKGVAAYLAGTYLPTSLIPSRIDDNLPVRVAGQATGLSAYIQLSDYGKREQEDAMLTIAAKWRAKVKLELKRHIDDGGKGFPDMGDELNGMMRKNPWLRQYAIQTYRALAREKAREERGIRRRSPVRKVIE